MRTIWRFLRYGPTALKVLRADLERTKHDLLLQGADIETLRAELRTKLGTQFLPPEKELTEEQIKELRRRRVPGLTDELEAQIDWSRM